MTILRGLPFPAYLTIPAAHFSGLKEIDTGPAHYAHALINDRADTDALRAGRAIHSLILTRGAGDVVTWPGKVRRGKEWDRFAAEHADATILTRAEIAMAEGMCAAVAAHPLASALLTGGEAEVSLTWDDPTVGPCKARIDYLRPDGTMIELKTTIRRGRSAIAREIAARLYYAQNAFYLDGLRANGIVSAEPPRLIAVEKTGAFVPHVFRVGDGPLENGRRKVDGWLRKVAECQASGVWRDADESDLVLPAWVDGDVEAGGELEGLEVEDGE